MIDEILQKNEILKCDFVDEQDKKDRIRKLNWGTQSGQTKFLDLFKSDQFKATCLQECWRPVQAEHVSAKKIVFTLDDRYVCYDVAGDSKLMFFEWDDLRNLHDVTNVIIPKIKQFRERNLSVIDGLKTKLVRERFFIEDDTPREANNKKRR